ncbi:dihydroorotate dehydrogenase [Pleomorphomonas carboxyditropha]|uniref:Dihydroorotate dehydrogenase catalytic domain-containing protein n=1 Tax=Pleomorphomonas carboxyditropha TaxID=2023338 RepID=A0A2G9WP10_9HYPH|nr:dihydroorotate dehydrogenase [Pleomorphomonas carboxyditropha]PIO96449.1 hypothetical protein CJ014_25405 [Pleomorphomonas carboxyditropha]
MTLLPPTYDIARSYEENLSAGPVYAGAIPPAPASRKTWSFLGFELSSPIGVPAGPLLNAAYVDLYAQLGWDVPVYKTVRSVARASHPVPNCLFISTDTLSEADAHSVRAVAPAPQSVAGLTITNSFGMPSMAPDDWQADIRRASEALRPGQLLVVSVVGTPGADGRGLEDDFAHTAALAKAAGARVIEANFSCPNVASAEGELFRDARTSASIVRKIKQRIGDTPLIIKIGALPEEHLAAVVEACLPFLDGVAAINTVPLSIVDAEGNQALPGTGRLKSGVCGAAISEVATEMTARLLRIRDRLNAKFAVVSVGGVMSERDIDGRLAMGADLVMSATAAMWDPLLAHRWKDSHG